MEEEHARTVLEQELGVEFRQYDDGSAPGMPDLLSLDGNHVAEVITTSPSAVRKAQKSLQPTPNATLPHCVQVVVPYMVVGGATKVVRGKIEADVLRWVSKRGCHYHWSSRDALDLRPGIDPIPILGLGAYEDGVKALCVQRCQHSEDEFHQIGWTVEHGLSTDDPWEMIRRSLHLVEREQRGGVSALAKKLNHYPNKHLVMYPFGPPENLTAALGRYVLPSDPHDMLPPQLNPPLADIHVWLLYRYGDRDVVEGLHVCDGRWARFGTMIPKLDRQSPEVRSLHYREASEGGA